MVCETTNSVNQPGFIFEISESGILGRHRPIKTAKTEIYLSPENLWNCIKRKVNGVRCTYADPVCTMIAQIHNKAEKNSKNYKSKSWA